MRGRDEAEIVPVESTWVRQLVNHDGDGNPVDVSGWAFSAQCRRDPDPTSPLILEFTVDAAEAANGVVNLVASTAGIEPGTTGWWDWKETAPGASPSRPSSPMFVRFGGVVTP